MWPRLVCGLRPPASSLGLRHACSGVHLGAQVTVRTPSGSVGGSFTLPRDHASFPTVVHASTDDTIQAMVPLAALPDGSTLSRTDASLVSTCPARIE